MAGETSGSRTTFRSRSRITPASIAAFRTIASASDCRTTTAGAAPSTSDNDVGVLNRDWYQVGPGDGMWALFDPKDSNLVWSTSTNSDTGQVYLFDERTKQVAEVSPDAESNGELAASALKYRFNWETPIAFTNDGKALVGGNVVFESADRGQTWSVISPDLTRHDASKERESGGPIANDESGAEIYDTILYLATTRLADGIIWATTDDGLVQLDARCEARIGATSRRRRRSAGGARCAHRPGRFAPGRRSSRSSGTCSATIGPTCFVPTTTARRGDRSPNILPANQFLFVRAIRQDPVNADLLYAGTNRGVWTSLDGGAHWTSLRLNMPATAIYDLEVQPTPTISSSHRTVAAFGSSTT